MVPASKRLAILLCTAAGAVIALAESPFKFESTPGKLPKDIVPRHYAIRLQPDLERFVTSGRVDIAIEVLKPAQRIVLNALDMEISSATLNGRKTVPLTPNLNPDAQTVTFALPETFAPGKYALSINFTGHIRDQAQGLFYVRYLAGGSRKLMLASQMEPADARRMFPCWGRTGFPREL